MKRFRILSVAVAVEIGKYNPAILPYRLSGTVIAVICRADDCLAVLAYRLATRQVQIGLQLVHSGFHTQVPTVVFKCRNTHG